MCYNDDKEALNVGSFGKQLFKLRRETNSEAGSGYMSQEEFGKLLGLSRNSIYNYENDKRTPSVEDLIKISKSFNVSTDWLLGLDDVQSRDYDVHEICNKLGISERAVKRIRKITSPKYNPPGILDEEDARRIALLNIFLESDALSMAMTRAQILITGFGHYRDQYESDEAFKSNIGAIRAEERAFDYQVFQLERAIKKWIEEAIENAVSKRKRG